MMPAVSPDASISIEPMTDADWPVVRHIYQEGIATGDATLEREAPDWDHFDRSHRRDCRLVARSGPGGPRRRLGRPDGLLRAARLQRRGLGERVRGRRCPRSGRGRALLDALIDASEAAGLWTLQAGVLADNAASLALHQRVGFRRVGVQKGLGQDRTGRWRDVVLLERRSEAQGLDGL